MNALGGRLCQQSPHGESFDDALSVQVIFSQGCAWLVNVNCLPSLEEQPVAYTELSTSTASQFVIQHGSTDTLQLSTCCQRSQKMTANPTRRNTNWGVGKIWHITVNIAAALWGDSTRSSCYLQSTKVVFKSYMGKWMDIYFILRVAEERVRDAL